MADHRAAAASGLHVGLSGDPHVHNQRGTHGTRAGAGLYPNRAAEASGCDRAPDGEGSDFRYSRDQLESLFRLAYLEDVEKGGRYDGRSGAINTYTHPWKTETMRAESTLMGSVYAFWGDQNRIWQIETVAHV